VTCLLNPTFLQRAWATTVITALLDRCRTVMTIAFFSHSPSEASPQLSHTPVIIASDVCCAPRRVTLPCAGRSHSPKDRTSKGYDRIPDPVFSQEVRRFFFTIVKGLNPATLWVGDLPAPDLNDLDTSIWPPKRCSCRHFTHSRRFAGCESYSPRSPL